MTDFYLFKSALRDLLRFRRLLVTGLLIAAPAVIAYLLRLRADPGSFKPAQAYDVLAPALVFGFLLVILAVVYGSGVISQEVEQKTIVYLLTRPVPRWRVLLMKFLAAILVITATSWVALALLALVALGPKDMFIAHLKRDVLMTPIGAMAYGAVFLLLATIVNRPLIWGLLYTFGIESWAPNVPGIQKISLMAYIRVLSPHASLEKESVDLTELMQALSPTTISSSVSWWVLGSVIAVALLAALFIFSRSEYVPREDAE